MDELGFKLLSVHPTQASSLNEELIKGATMYTEPNFKTKKELKEAVASGKEVTVFNPGPFGEPPRNGEISVEGPHFPKPHTWYARVTLKDGKVIKVS